MNKGQHNTFKKLSPDFFSIEVQEKKLAFKVEFSYND